MKRGVLEEKVLKPFEVIRNPSDKTKDGKVFVAIVGEAIAYLSILPCWSYYWASFCMSVFVLPLLLYIYATFSFLAAPLFSFNS